MSDSGSPEQNRRKELLKPLWFLFTVGWYVVLSLVIPTGIGVWLDEPQQFNTSPLYTLIGFALGTVLAAFGLYRMLKQFVNSQKEIQNNKQKEDK